MPFRDYHDELHPLLWRSWWDFGDGSVGDWGCHNLDGPFWALKLAQSNPTSVEVVMQEGGSDERFPLAERDPLELSGAGQAAAGQGLLVRRLLRQDRPHQDG